MKDAAVTQRLGTLRPYAAESVHFDTTENLIIEGDKLEVLNLSQKSYVGKLKEGMIVIGLPTTGNQQLTTSN